MCRNTHMFQRPNRCESRRAKTPGEGETMQEQADSERVSDHVCVCVRKAAEE